MILRKLVVTTAMVIIWHVGCVGATVKKTTTTSVKIVPPVPKKVAPVAGNTYTVQYLLDRIRLNNPDKNSHFIVSTDVKGVAIYVTDNDKYWQAKDVNGIWIDDLRIGGSKSVPNFTKISDWVSTHLNESVQVFEDTTLIDFLSRTVRLTDATKDKYKKILLYFKVPITTTIKNPTTKKNEQVTVYYRCYLNDPYPGLVRGIINPAQSIIDSWDV